MAHGLDRIATIAIVRNDGAGNFGGFGFLPVDGEEVAGLALGDFNGDGRDDVAGSGRSFAGFGSTRVWYAEAGGRLRRGNDLSDALPSLGGSAFLAGSDLNQDGFDDLLAAQSGGATLAYLGGPEGLASPSMVPYGPSLPEFLFAGNFVGNEGSDLVAAGPQGVFLTAGELLRDIFRRGDHDADGRFDICDAVSLLSWLYLGGKVPACEKSADVNDDGSLEITNPVYMLNFLFLEGAAPADPFRRCGNDPQADVLSCTSHSVCRG